jgi:hypothetical protein
MGQSKLPQIICCDMWFKILKSVRWKSSDVSEEYDASVFIAEVPTKEEMSSGWCMLHDGFFLGLLFIRGDGSEESFRKLECYCYTFVSNLTFLATGVDISKAE